MTKIQSALEAHHFPQLDIASVLDKALQHGGELAEIYFERNASTRIIYEGGKVDQVVDGTDSGAGLRVIFGLRTFYAFSTELKQDSLESIAQDIADAIHTAQNARGGTPAGETRIDIQKIEWAIAQQSDAGIRDFKVEKSPRDLGLPKKVEIAKEIASGAEGELPGARQISAYVLDSQRDILVINSDGLIAPDQKTYFHMVCQVVGEKEGRVESGFYSDGGFIGMEFLQKHPPASIGKKAAEQVKILLDAKPAPSGTMPVVLAAEAGGTMVHEAVGHGLEADLACTGLSVYEGKLGQKVASELITVIDDGTQPERRGSYRFDDEGTASKKNVLIENGVLKSYMVDRLSAYKHDLMATGNGRRESFRHKPIVRMTNTYIAPGKEEPSAILKDTKKGIYVKSMGGGQVNTVTGDFVFAVTEGYLIRDGQIGEPIRGATLVGNGPKVLKEIDRVGSDLGYATGTCGKDGQRAPVTDAQPTLRIPNLTVGGEVPMQDYWAD